MTCEHSDFGTPCQYYDGHAGTHSWEEVLHVGPAPADPLTEEAWQAYAREVIDPMIEALELR